MNSNHHILLEHLRCLTPDDFMKLLINDTILSEYKILFLNQNSIHSICNSITQSLERDISRAYQNWTELQNLVKENASYRTMRRINGYYEIINNLKNTFHNIEIIIWTNSSIAIDTILSRQYNTIYQYVKPNLNYATVSINDLKDYVDGKLIILKNIEIMNSLQNYMEVHRKLKEDENNKIHIKEIMKQSRTPAEIERDRIFLENKNNYVERCVEYLFDNKRFNKAYDEIEFSDDCIIALAHFYYYSNLFSDEIYGSDISENDIIHKSENSVVIKDIIVFDVTDEFDCQCQDNLDRITFHSCGHNFVEVIDHTIFKYNNPHNFSLDYTTHLKVSNFIKTIRIE